MKDLLICDLLNFFFLVLQRQAKNDGYNICIENHWITFFDYLTNTRIKRRTQYADRSLFR